jgi:FKBP-type peptidyl-prolyl cis-trans isomerase 2
MEKIKNGDKVTVHYTGKLEDGSVFDSSKNEGRQPLTETIGTGRLIKGFESGLIGMSIGESKTVEIESADAYGSVNEQLITEIPKSNVPEGVKVGETLQGNGPQGPIMVRITEVKDETVIVDANHPLAGKKLIFDIEVVSVN